MHDAEGGDKSGGAGSCLGADRALHGGPGGQHVVWLAAGTQEIPEGTRPQKGLRPQLLHRTAVGQTALCASLLSLAAVLP